MYGIQLLEAFCSPTFEYLCNIQTPECAERRLQRLKESKPQVAVSIENFHHEDVKIETGTKERLTREYERDLADFKRK